MKNRLLAVTVVAALGAPMLFAGDPEMCLDCHEPAEDWEGLSPEQVLEQAKDTSIKRHADNAELSDEQLQAMIATLLAK